MSSGMKMTNVEFTTKQVQTCGDMIIEIGNYNISMEMPMMGQPIDDKGKYVTIWEKQSDGSLKIKIETWNTDINPMEGYQAEM
jgi:ketosteroid isomerase-like protein